MSQRAPSLSVYVLAAQLMMMKGIYLIPSKTTTPLENSFMYKMATKCSWLDKWWVNWDRRYAPQIDQGCPTWPLPEKVNSIQ